MASTFSNPRWDALPCERMLGCSFADDFLTLERTEQNHGTDQGTGNSFDHGLTTDGNGYVDYDLVGVLNISAVIRFKADSTSTGILIGNANLISGSAADGFCVWVDSTGVRANHSDGVSIPTRCSVDVSYADGEWHTVTYIVNQSTGDHYLYVDALAVDSQSTTISLVIGTTNPLTIAGDGSDNFTGTIQKARILTAEITEADHDLYHADTLETFFWSPLAAYRCDNFGNDTDGDKIWDRTTETRDLTQGDGVTAATFPGFEAATDTEDDKYLFDFVDDYVSGLFTLPSQYTVTACLSTPHSPYPYVRQENDTTLLDLLTTGGAYWGHLRSLVIHSGQLTDLQKYADEYQHLYWQWRGRAFGAYHRLITEGLCKMAMFLDADYWVYRDYSKNWNSGTGKDVTRATGGCTFDNAASHVAVEHDSSLKCEDVTIVIMGDFSGSVAAGTIVDKGTNYKFRTNGNQLDFNGSTIAHTFSDNEQIAVVCKSGEKPRFFVDGEYIGEGSTTEIPDNTDTTDLTVGNNNETNERTRYLIKQVFIGNQALTDAEIKALYQQGRMIGATPMETGTRTRDRNSFTGTTVDVDVDPGGPFQLIDVSFSFNTAPTTGEDITIKSKNSDTDEIEEYDFDPSLSSELTHVFRFDKRFPDGTTIMVDYPNTDTRNIVVNVVYQLDESVT